MKLGFTASSLVFIILLPFSSFAQKSRGDQCYSSYDYRAAISFYQKAITSNPGDTASLVRLANCYAILKDYDNAETYYSMAAAVQGISPKVYYNYANILKNNGKLDRARAQFAKYSSLVPSDSNGKAQVRYCDHLKKTYYIAYQVSTVDGINSKFSDFSPVYCGDNLVFVSDRGEDLVNFERSTNTGGNYFKMFVAKPLSKGFDKPQSFSTTINGVNADFNVGPATFTADGKTVYYTQVAALRKRKFINQAKIFYCTSDDGKKWSKPQPFPYNSDDYSVMDPAISPDGQWLYFASTMPGGYGGSDLYVCQKTADGWSKPLNLGAEVNTPGNEGFPYVRSDGTLFFSSDRHFNYGGLDIFSCQRIENMWTDVENLGPDINSSTDDFGICFNKNNRTGFFSSNRKGGLGNDDIYSFFYIGDYKPLKGTILFSYNLHDPVPSVDVKLLNDSGQVIANGKTDSLGQFRFTNLDPDKRYMVTINENDPRFAGKKRFYLADSTGKIIAVTLMDKKMGMYTFTKLPPDLSKMPKMDAVDKNINIAGNLLQGDSSKPISNARVSLLNDKGEVIASTTTNEFGAFVFSNLPPDNNYTFQVEPAQDTKLPPNMKVTLTDKNGNTIKTFNVPGNGKFKFELLAADTTTISRMKVDDTQLRYVMKSVLLDENKKPMANVKISIVDKDGNVLQTTTTDANGQYVFTNLPPDKTYFIQLDQNDPRLGKMKMVYIADTRHNIIRELDLGHGFRFEMLAADKSKMGTMTVYDPWIEALNLKNKNNSKKDSLHIIENILYDYQKWDILPSAEHVLNKVIEVMKSDPNIIVELDAFTDPRGSDEYNLQLSQKRADAAVAYMVAHGISKSRVTGKGFGETHLLNHCGDPGVTCTEEEYAVNRRTEFKITRKK